MKRCSIGRLNRARFSSPPEPESESDLKSWWHEECERRIANESKNEFFAQNHMETKRKKANTSFYRLHYTKTRRTTEINNEKFDTWNAWSAREDYKIINFGEGFKAGRNENRDYYADKLLSIGIIKSRVGIDKLQTILLNDLLKEK